MGDRHDYVALDWVKGEIEEVLKQAQYELEAYVEAPDDTARLKFCLTYLHQVRGTLQMVEFYGAAMLAEEMEAVVQAMLDDSVSHAAEAREVLMQAILQLPNYLDHIKLGRRDLPVVLLPVLNDLRGARGESLLSETSLFQPSLKAVAPLNDKQLRQFSDKQFLDILRKLRQMYQVALLGVLKGKDTQHNLEYLQKVSNRLAKLFANTPAESLWTVASAVLDGLLNDGIRLNSAVKELLKQLEPELRNIVNNGAQALEHTPEELLKNLLFYVARAEKASDKITQVRNDYKLSDALPSSSEVDEDRKALGGPDKATMGSVAAALIEEITRLKEELDQLVHDKVAQPSQLASLVPGFKQISDTMGMLGLGVSRKVIQDQFEIVKGFVDSNKAADNTQLMDIAGALLYVEATLVGLSDRFGSNKTDNVQTQQLGEAQQVVLKESKNFIEKVKELVVEYTTKQGDLSLLGEAADSLMNLRGTLIMVPQMEAADIARSCSNILHKQVDTQQAPSDVLLDALAESLSGIEYFLERLEENNHGDSSAILVRAREAILPFMATQDLAPDDSIIDAQAIEDDLEDVDFSQSPVEVEEMQLEAAEHLTESDEVEGESIEFGLPIDNFDEAESEDEISFELDDALDVESNDSLALPSDQIDEEKESAQALNAQFSESLKSLEDEPEDDADWNLAIDDAFESDDALNSVTQESESASEIPEAIQVPEPVVTSDFEDDDDLIDDEIIEIFLEEAQEVLETIEEFWPVFKANHGDSDALTTTRRAFHTLKGSGRMVGAEDIGETAWAIENMFNRLLDNTISISEPFTDIVDFVVTQVPQLISNFEKRQPSDIDVKLIQEYADAISKGEEVAPCEQVMSQALQDHIDQAQQVQDSLETQEPALTGLDPALLEVFSSEVESHLKVVQDFIDAEQSSDYSSPITDELQRALHTLKGSAHMAHIESIADIAGVLENFAKDLRAYHVETTAEIIHLFIRGKDLIDEGFSQLATNPFGKISGSEDITADVQRLSQQLIQQFHQKLGTNASRNNVDPQVLSIFLSEGMDILTDVEQSLEDWESDASKVQLLDAIIDELHTLEKGAQMADLLPIVSLCKALQTAYEKVEQLKIAADDPFINSIKDGHEGLLNMMDMVAASQAVVPAADLIEQLTNVANQSDENNLENDIHVDDETNAEDSIELELPSVDVEAAQAQGDIDPELLDIFLEEAQELIDSISASLDEWQSDRDNLLQVAELQRDLHTFKGGARMAEINAIGDLAHELEDLYEGLSLGRLTANDQLFDLLHLCHDRLADMVNNLSKQQPIKSAPELITAIQLFIAGESLELPADKTSVETPEPLAENSADQPESISVTTMALDADAEVVEIFLEEAEELMEELDAAILQWQGEPDNSVHNESLQRILHTFKGGARIAGLSEIGDLAHNMEDELQHRLMNKQAADDALFKNLHEQYDLIASRIDSVQLWLNQGGQGALVIEGESTNVAVEIPAEDLEHTSNVVTLPVAKAPAQTQTSEQVSQPQAASQAQQARIQPQEMIKVPAELLDGLVNLAGETSISRGRLENQVTDFSYTLEEMDSTLDRLKDQLRRLDIETEAQVLFRREQQGPDYEDFDPLEMDRYSQLQQLSRSLVESASDLIDIKATLLNKTKDAETLLLQQSRVNTELQEGLMKTRMVPFSRLVPRLRRIVRQVGQELGKQVELHVSNAEGEMDRSVLERLISPLEHMLRNAVDHGLESQEKRAAAGKPETGNIYLDLSRDGGDVVLRLADDGAGINLQAVRNKAIERGLLEASTKLPDQEILQFILQAGFSTAEKVTQISGRGVGMDVVNSEIKQVGGTVVIDSQEGKGTEFVIRLPFTVSVNRALMTKVGEALFAIPLNSIEGIVRISAKNLLELYKQDKPVYHYGGREYQLEYLGNLLRDENIVRLTDNNTPMPVVLVRGSQPAAIQVDTLMGSREIVVKTLGPQFNSVLGVSGGTILGDGSVVIILDLPNMMRHVNSLEYKQHIELEHQAEAKLEHANDGVTSVLVVDDSVTVRKVTTRLLERNGMEVRTAKDGIDALEVLQDHIPDVVLLDIEMPRMDGFEVATQMRHHSVLKNVPIIMITSRTGDKHKERAMSIGVNEYLGKPFQEDILLGAIKEITGKDQ
ncbi:MAG: chemosensory pili system protein ChpA (sensor histidine kinase/response regulator) [Bermanella sp.]|jgi:chemosensory pili system protein ChpA (sensor histidine kinase/response regulator)